MAQALTKIETALLDIEGTICPISFVKDTLFPYAIRALPDVLKEKWDDPELAPYLDAFPPDARSSPEALEAHVQDLTKRDVKIAYLKNLQGYLWEFGYTSAAYSTPLFDDVLPSLDQWRDKGITLSIYSSGSVFAQKLLFGHIRDKSSGDSKASVDRQDLIADWFDTVNAGSKSEPESYTQIANMLRKNTSRILFLSDNAKEVRAAKEAGMLVRLVDRPGNARLGSEDIQQYGMVRSLNEIEFAD